MLKNRQLHCPEKGATRFVRIFQIIFHLISYFLAYSIAMDQACRWVNIFLAYLAMLCPMMTFTHVTAAIRQWRRRLSACVQAGDGHYEHYF